jgi:hypothetical protein
MPKFVTKDGDVWPSENTEDQRYYHQVLALYKLVVGELPPF